MFRILTGVLLFAAFAPPALPDEPKAKSAREALQPFNHLIGQWKGTAIPYVDRDDFWVETMDWSWHFQGEDASLVVAFDKSKKFTKGRLDYLPEGDKYRLTLETPQQDKLSFEGKLEDKMLTLQREDPKAKEVQTLAFRFLHPNRFLYQYSVRAGGSALGKRIYQVGATKLGEAFATGDGSPECIVSGGQGTTPVVYKGKTYYVCCSGCRDEFLANPEQYVEAYEKKGKSGN